MRPAMAGDNQTKAENQAVNCSQAKEAEAIQGERRRKKPGGVPGME